MSYYEFYETTADGEPKEKPIRYHYSEARNMIGLRVPPDMPVKNLIHFLELAASAPNHPVDVTHWKGEGELRALAYSARLVYFTGASQLLISLPASSSK